MAMIMLRQEKSYKVFLALDYWLIRVCGERSNGKWHYISTFMCNSHLLSLKHDDTHKQKIVLSDSFILVCSYSHAARFCYSEYYSTDKRK